jgi:molecular chaperone GrpE
MTNETENEVVTYDVLTQEDVVVEAPGQESDPVASLTAVLTELLATLDDVDRASQHGELTGGFKAVADQLASIANRFGLEKYGNDGDLFDPQIHEALMHDTSADVAVATASKILQPGYRYKERILRPARVSVTEPEA